MRYSNLKAFQKHLESASPHNLCSVYLVAIADDFERNKAFDLILSQLKLQPTRFSGSDLELRDYLNAIESGSLFGSTVVLLDALDQVTKKPLETIKEALHRASGILLFGTRSKTALAPLIEKEGVILDLLEEKPWDKEKRLADQLIERGKRGGKRVLADVPPFLIDRLGVEAALLDSEMDKLISYTGDRSQITRDDVLAISPASRTSTLWQIAEEVIWEGASFPSLDPAAFHSLIPLLRNQLHLGLSLAALIEEKIPSDEWNRYLPTKLWPKTLEKRSSQSARLGSPYFEKGLHKLLEIELLSRSHSTQYRALLDLFRAFIHVR